MCVFYYLFVYVITYGLVRVHSSYVNLLLFTVDTDVGLIVSLLLDFFFLSSPPPLAVTRLCFHVTNAFAPPPNPYAKHVPHLSPFSLYTLSHAESAAARRPGASRLAEFASGGSITIHFAGLSPRPVDGNFERE